jgi:hypothetical protein
MYRTILAALTLFSIVANATEVKLSPLPLEQPSETLPEAWTGHQQAHLDRIEGSHSIVQVENEIFLRLTKNNMESVLQIKTTVDLPPHAEKMRLVMEHRVPQITLPETKPGRNRFRVGVTFLDADGKSIKSHTPQIAVGEPINDWASAEQMYDVPTGAVKVEIGIGQLLCSGIWEIKDLELHVESREIILP